MAVRLDAAVTDTHALLYHAAGRGLGPKAAALFQVAEDREALIYVPMAVIWEITLLARVGKVNLRRTTRAFFMELFTNPAYQPFDLTSEQVFAADEWRFSRDPFDALIVAAAQELNIPLLTRDDEIVRSESAITVW
jgi:PIN domain nuclease of toxin-antitoxin system